MDNKGITPGTLLWLCYLCGNVTEQQEEGCTCKCKEMHEEEPKLQIYLGYSIVIEEDEVETTVYRFYSVCEDAVWSSTIEGLDIEHIERAGIHFVGSVGYIYVI